MTKIKTEEYYTPYQLKMPLEISQIIEISDPVYTFTEVMDHIDLKKYFVEEGYRRTGRPRCDCVKMLKRKESEGFQKAEGDRKSSS